MVAAEAALAVSPAASALAARWSRLSTDTPGVWMIAVGYLFFGDVPDLWTLVGAAIVVASGLFVFAGEARALRTPATA